MKNRRRKHIKIERWDPKGGVDEDGRGQKKGENPGRHKEAYLASIPGLIKL